jgi:hypothetical protein
VDRSEQLDYRPAWLFVVEHFVHKYACPYCSRSSGNAPGQPSQPDQESDRMPATLPEPSQPGAAVPGPYGPRRGGDPRTARARIIEVACNAHA